MFAPVPCCWPDGRKKRFSGWSICRRPPFRGLDTLGQVDVDDITTVTSTEFTSTVNENSDEESTVAIDAIDDDGEYEMRKEEERKKRLAALNDDVQPDTFLFVPPLGLPAQWIEVVDSEEEEEVSNGCRVLCVRHKTGQGSLYQTTVLRGYGTVLNKKNKLCYSVQFDDFDRATVGRQYIEVITKRTFFCNIEKGLYAWTIDEAVEAERAYNEFGITIKCPIVTDARVWLELKELSFMRRSFQDHDEMLNDLSDLIFYVEELVLSDEFAALKIQRFIRKRRKFPHPVFYWVSRAFSFSAPDAVISQMHYLNGWTYIRRRSTFVGEFNSVQGEEWEEYVDSISSEYLYWHEESNTHMWIKPETHKANKLKDSNLDFKIGDEVEFRFPGDYKDEVGIVVGIRTDDETGEFLYDVTRSIIRREKRVPVPPEDFVPIKWVARFRLKKPQMDREATELARLEVQWRETLRRQKAAEERMKKKQKQDRLNDSLAKIKEKLLAVQNQADADAALVIKDKEKLEVVEIKEKEDNVMTQKEAKAAHLNAAELLDKGYTYFTSLNLF